MIGSRLAARVRTSPERLLDAVRMLGVGVVSALGQRVVDMPSGYFGAAAEATSFGLAYALVTVLGALVAALATLAGRRWARWWFTILVLLAVAFLLPALASDMTVAGSILAWQLGVLARLLASPLAPRTARPDRQAPLRRCAAHLLGLAIAVTVMIVGLRATDMLAIELICLVLDLLAITSVVLVLRRDAALPRGTLTLVLAAPLVALALEFSLASCLAALGVVQAGLLFLALREGPMFAELVEQFVQRPALLVIATFAAIAGAGGAVLSFPAAAEAARISPLDALFTSMSATCVTGLAVVDTPIAFSMFGEVVILLLIQVGGLGMMVLSTFATVILGGRLTLRGEQALGQVLELSSPGHAYRLVRFIVAATGAIEALGALLLIGCFLAHGVAPADAIWRGVFHSISAFCNAGFALQSDSIVMFQSNPFALAVHGLLITLGGLGFVVLAWLWARTIQRERSRPPVQVRVVLWLSLALVIAGALLYAALEWQASLAGLSTFDKLSNALFQSVTTRTAGFNSVDLMLVEPATILVMIALMFIGASPGGTGGGIKVTTLAVLGAAIPGIVGTQAGATLFGRSVGATILQRAATITLVATLSAGAALFVLLISEDAAFEVLAFEVVSALGTVGLSLGFTPSLSTTGKLVIIVTMFIGRVGPLTLALALGRRTPSAIAYPETRIMVG